MLYLILFVIPAFFANAIPVLLGGGRAIDGGKKFIDGRPILGKSKTVRGFIAGTFTGMLICELFYLLEFIGVTLFIFPFHYAVTGFLLGFGSMLGDSIGSFIKRRLKYKSSANVPLIDQLLFIIVAVVLSIPMIQHSTVTITTHGFAVILILTLMLHKVFNLFANKYGYKNVPW